MGIIKRGILGGFQNKTGAVVGVRWRGLDVMRGLPRTTTKNFSQGQKDHQTKFKLLSHLLSMVAPVINIGFRERQTTTTAKNRAMAYNLGIPLIGESPNLRLDYSMLSFSRGKCALPMQTEVLAWPQSELSFSWSYSGSRDKQENDRDLISFLIFNPARDQVMMVMRKATRADQHFKVTVPSGFSGETIYAYLVIESSTTLGSVSNSLFLGAVLMP
jgi:hypothetical protein